MAEQSYYSITHPLLKLDHSYSCDNHSDKELLGNNVLSHPPYVDSLVAENIVPDLRHCRLEVSGVTLSKTIL